MNALNGQQINSLIKSCVDEKALNSIIVNFNMNAKTKPREINKMLLLNEKFKKLFGEVFTPILLVEEMLDKLPKEVWKDKNLKWVDPACGTCNFILVIKEKLMESLKDIIEGREEREKWILEQMLYGVDIQERNVVLSKLRLDPYNKFKLHIEAHDSLNFDFWKLNPDQVIVVGNPPYGKNANLAVNFLNKASTITKNIYFVLPKSVRKPSIINRMNLNLHCIDDIDVDIKTFENGISTCMCKFEVRKEKREIIDTKTTHEDFEFTTLENADICLGRVGAGPCGRVYLDNFNKRSPNSHYFIKIKKDNVAEIFKKLEKEFRRVGFQTVGCPSLSKNDLISLYEGRINE